MKKISRARAKARGLKRYFTGKLCIHGHVAERQTSSDMCVECRRHHQRQLYKQSPERYRERVRRYYYSSKGRERTRRYRQSPECREVRQRYYRSPKGREHGFRASRSPKGRQGMRRYDRSPKGCEKRWRYAHSLTGIENRHRYRQTEGYRVKRRETRSKHYLENLEAIYKDNPSETNFNRLMNLIARRMRDGR